MQKTDRKLSRVLFSSFAVQVFSAPLDIFVLPRTNSAEEKQKTMIRNIIFDMGGVLLDLDRQRCVDSFAAIGYPQAEQMLSNYAQTGIFGDLERGRVTPAEFYDHIRRETGRDTSDSDIARALNSFIVGMPEYKLQMLSDLRGRFGIYMLSNTNAIMIPYIRETWFTLHGLTFDDYFDRAFLSYEMGEIKPAESIFLDMIEQGGLTPSECLFIDDGPSNIDTASRLGFHTYLAADHEDFRHIFDKI